MIKDELILRDKLTLLEKELAAAAERIDEIAKSLGEFKDIEIELKALKLYLGRVHPEFKKDFPPILKKLK